MLISKISGECDTYERKCECKGTLYDGYIIRR